MPERCMSRRRPQSPSQINSNNRRSRRTSLSVRTHRIRYSLKKLQSKNEKSSVRPRSLLSFSPWSDASTPAFYWILGQSSQGSQQNSPDHRAGSTATAAAVPNRQESPVTIHTGKFCLNCCRIRTSEIFWKIRISPHLQTHKVPCT